MSKEAVNHLGRRLGKRARARLRSLRRRAQAWKSRVRRAAALSLAAAAMWGGQTAFAQLGSVGTLGGGQMGMAPAGGIVNRAVAGFQALDENGPGWLYYGINAADRGLGYNGSYFTLGGFIPYAEDDLGGLWSADLRSHLSTYGGFFSNVGIVRKQFMGGTIGGIGVYWDYDADSNQYPTSGQCGTGTFGQFGHVYNQVGVSGEWLTDFGNLRSNGYIPVGTAAYTAGNPGSVFYQNYVMCNYGLDAALAGADLEVGAYVPGLADWAGMISVGGYTFGQARYNWAAGSRAGKDVVPYFGGVYTRLDVTLMRNWDFSLQANNDSFFDWTGFARLTYRMGGSRRRNVPDQMEQPMMRNEHIVRAHQTPEVAINPETGTPWRVIHVNNAGTAPGTGTTETPFTTLAAADAAATNPWDVVLVSRGDGTSTGYNTEFSFNAPNQSLVGIGSPFYLASVCCGPINIAGPTGTLPLLSNPAGASVFIDGAVAGGATVANLQITGSGVGIEATGNLNGLPTAAFPGGRPTTVDNVSITGSGSGALETGVLLANATGDINFTSTAISNMTNGGFVVSGGNSNVNYQGSITNDSTGAATPASYLVNIQDTTGGKINLAVGGTPGTSTVANAISDQGGAGLLIKNNADTTTINMANVSLKDNLTTAIAVANDSSTVTITAAAGTGIEKSTAGAAITVEGAGPSGKSGAVTYSGPITNSSPSTSKTSYAINVSNTTDADVRILGDSIADKGNGIQLLDNNGSTVAIDNASISSQGATGILVNGNTGGTFSFSDITIDKASSAGVLVTNSDTPLTFSNLNITLTDANAIGFQANNAGGGITANQTNSISTASTTVPAVSITNTPNLDMTFTTITSAVTSGSNAAMDFTGSTGTFTVLGAFTVGGSKGTVAADVTPNPLPGGMSVIVPP
jgi:hypothetical protein